MSSLRLGGIVSTVVTPFTEQDEVDDDLLRAEVQYLLGTGVSGICACGSTGEGHTLSVEESAAVCRVVVEEVGGRVPVVGGVIQNSTAAAIRYGRALKEAGVDALQITPVHYVFAPGPDQTVAYYERIARELAHPIVVYNVVPWALVPADVIERLVDIPEVVALKQSGGDVHLLADACARFRDRISILAALDDVLLACFLLGAQGALAAIPTVVPELSVRLWDAVQQGRLEEATALHEAILPVWRAIEGPNLPSLLKGALELQGRRPGLPRHPFGRATPEQLVPIRAALVAAGVPVPGTATGVGG